MNNHYEKAAKETLSEMGRYMMASTTNNENVNSIAKYAIAHYGQSILSSFDSADFAEVKLGFKPLKIKVA